jgi:hypothetical protein
VTSQAPLYYYLAGFIQSIAQRFQITSVGIYAVGLQLLSLVLSMLTILVARLCFIEAALASTPLRRPRRHWAVVSALLLFAFWPSQIIHSVRIGNDLLLYFLSACTFLGLLRCHNRISVRPLAFALCSMFLAISTKVSAVLLIPAVIGCVLLWTRRAERVTRPPLWALCGLALLSVITFYVAFGPAVAELRAGQPTTLVAPANINRLGPALAVGNGIWNNVGFDLVTFITQPFTDPYVDSAGRQLFWNYFLKTSLFGQFSYAGGIAHSAAQFASILALIILATAGTNMLASLYDRQPAVIISSLFFFSWIVGTLAYSVLYPFSCNRDFRFAAPALIVLCWFGGDATTALWHSGRKRLCAVLLLVIGLFALTAVFFVVGLSIAPA